MTIDFAHPNPNAKYKVSISNYGWFPDQVHLNGYDSDPDLIRHNDINHTHSDQDASSDLTDLSDEGYA